MSKYLEFLFIFDINYDKILMNNYFKILEKVKEEDEKTIFNAIIICYCTYYFRL